MPELAVYQSLWATEQRIPGIEEAPIEARFEQVKAAGFDGMAVDLGALDLATAKTTVPYFARYGLGGLLTAFPKSIEDLRPALHLAKEIGAPFVVVVGQVMPLSLDGMIPVIREWLAVAAQEGVPIQFETHRNCITNDLFTALQLLDAIPEMRMAADLSHYVVDREMPYPIPAELQVQVGRILARSDSFQGRIATRQQVQVPIGFPQHGKWLDVFLAWWRDGFARWKARAGADDRLIFLCELGPRDYAITDGDGKELSDRAQEALMLKHYAREIWASL
ncbi:sugar phosphate isomerase/epimerase [Oleomonas cavernae]|uniref:Sugar phosphate isomerase/epimerase n=1 Tax=Oleomonas cavernae TaxID=2320859 RepID=A0A418WFY9_9PROT|nr:TIM barrel protein [Oleomonas cavernae]RJF88927.1 sugar phosphate isomerase/epimerase [Oleomonas cavernae]